MPIDLMTPWGEELKNTGSAPWQVYPRPQLVRDSYVNLNGEWDFCVRPETAFPGEYDHKILVPFCPESQLSGLQFHPEDGKYLFYRRSFVLPEGFNRGRVLLHFGAVDQKVDIYVNQKHLCHHLGGYESFTVDITDALADENEVIRHATDVVEKYGTTVLCTMDEHGSLYVGKDGVWRVGVAKYPLRGFSGAGDTYLAAFLYARYAQNSDVPTALSFAARASAAKIALDGTQLPTKEQIAAVPEVEVVKL